VGGLSGGFETMRDVVCVCEEYEVCVCVMMTTCSC